MTPKKVLIITYYWPPNGGGGVQRWLKFTKYLPQNGWIPVVYTPSNPTIVVEDQSLMNDIDPNIEVIRNPIWEPYGLAGTNKLTGITAGVELNKSKSIKGALAKFVRANLLLPDPRRFWIKPSLKFLKSYLEDNDIEAIISTGPPHSMHLIALGIKKRFPAIKWVADFRDPWSNFNFYLKLNPLSFSKKYNRSLERKVVQSADLVIATSDSTYDQLEKFNKEKFECITNGFDQDDFTAYEDISKSNRLVLLHAGTIKSDRNPIHLWQALDQALNSGKLSESNFELRLIGKVDNSVLQILEKYRFLYRCTKILNYVDHKTLINTHYAEANILLLLVNDSESSAANIPGKLFEYIYTKKPIMAIGSSGDDALRIVEIVGGISYKYQDRIEIKELWPWQKNKNISNKKSNYSRSSLTSRLVELLNKLIEEK